MNIKIPTLSHSLIDIKTLKTSLEQPLSKKYLGLLIIGISLFGLSAGVFVFSFAYTGVFKNEHESLLQKTKGLCAEIQTLDKEIKSLEPYQDFFKKNQKWLAQCHSFTEVHNLIFKAIPQQLSLSEVQVNVVEVEQNNSLDISIHFKHFKPLDPNHALNFEKTFADHGYSFLIKNQGMKPHGLLFIEGRTLKINPS